MYVSTYQKIMDKILCFKLCGHEVNPVVIMFDDGDTTLPLRVLFFLSCKKHFKSTYSKESKRKKQSKRLIQLVYYNIILIFRQGSFYDSSCPKKSMHNTT